MEIWDLLRMVVHHQASDLHLSAALPPMQRLHGEMCRLDLPATSSDELMNMLASVMTEGQKAQLEQYLECDFFLIFQTLVVFESMPFIKAEVWRQCFVSFHPKCQVWMN